MVVQRYSTTECLGCIVNAASKSNGAVTDSTGSTANNNDNNNMETAILLCPSCVSVSLQSVRERHQLAKETWYESRTKCAEYFQHQRQDPVVGGQSITAATTSTTVSNESTIRIYEQRYQQLRKELEALQQDCSKVTMETCALNLRIIEQQESISTFKDQYAAQRRQILSQFQQSLCGNNTCQNNNSTTNINNEMEDHTEMAEKSYATDMIHVRQNHVGAFLENIETTQATVRTLRFHWSLQAFAMFRIQIDEEDMFRSMKHKESGGNGTTSTETNEEKRNYRVDGTRRLRTGSSSRDSNKVVVSGIGKICGLPLPHAGMELYGVLPCEELQSALRLVAQLTHVIARCFHIRLPHPIVIVPPKQQQQRQPPTSSLMSEPMNQQRYASSSPSLNYQDGDIADLAYHSKHIPTKNLDGTYGYAPTAAGIHSITASLTSLSSILSGGGIIESRSATSASTSSRFQQQNQDLLLSMDPKHVEERIRHATSAIIAEDQSRTTFYTLSTVTPITDTAKDDILQQFAATSNVVNNNIKKPSDTGSTSQPQQKINDEFAIALQLLQNDILMICMNVGVPIDELYPGEALLLNLYALQMYCSENV